MNFSDALEALKKGNKLYRKSWHIFASFIYLVNGSEFEVNREPLNKILSPGTKVKYHPHIDIHFPDGSCGVFVPTTADILADDWDISPWKGKK